MEIEYADGSGRKVQVTDGMYPVEVLFLFPAYQTRAEFKAATGEDAPKYNAALPVKNWRDLSAATKRLAVYDAIKKQVDPPSIETFEMTGKTAASVNMLNDDMEIGDNSDGDFFPVPIRPLKDSEVLVQTGFGLAVRDVNLAPIPATGGFTAADRGLLVKIAAAVGIK